MSKDRTPPGCAVTAQERLARVLALQAKAEEAVRTEESAWMASWVAHKALVSAQRSDEHVVHTRSMRYTCEILAEEGRDGVRADLQVDAQIGVTFPPPFPNPGTCPECYAYWKSILEDS